MGNGIYRLKDFFNNIGYPARRPLLIFRIANDIFFSLMGKKILRSVQIDIGYECQLSCKHCYSHYMKAKEKELSIEEWDKIIKETINLGAVHFCISGGEPLLYKEKLISLIRLIDKTNSFTAIVTNGMLLDEKTVQKLKKAGLDMIIVSLDSYSEKDHDSNRNSEGSYKKAIESLKLAKKAGLVVMANTAVRPDDINDNFISSIVKNNKKIGAITNINLMVSIGKMKNSKLDYQQKIKELNYLLDKYRIAKCNDRNFMTKTCPAGKEKILITAYGDVMPCGLIQVSYGNLRNYGINEIILRMKNDKNLESHASKECSCLPANDRIFQKNVLTHIRKAKNLPLDYRKIQKRILSK